MRHRLPNVRVSVQNRPLSIPIATWGVFHVAVFFGVTTASKRKRRPEKCVPSTSVHI